MGDSITEMPPRVNRQSGLNLKRGQLRREGLFALNAVGDSAGKVSGARASRPTDDMVFETLGLKSSDCRHELLPTRVLMVTEDKRLASDLELRISEIGGKIDMFVVADPKKVTDAVSHYGPDSVFVDSRFPRAKTKIWSVLPKLKRRFPGLSFIVATSPGVRRGTLAARPELYGAAAVLDTDAIKAGHGLNDSLVLAKVSSR